MEYYSPDGEYVYWSHDGKCGTQSFKSPAGTYRRVLFVADGQICFTVGRREGGPIPSGDQAAWSYLSGQDTTEFWKR